MKRFTSLLIPTATLVAALLASEITHAHTKVVVLGGNALRYERFFADVEIAITHSRFHADEVWAFTNCPRGFPSRNTTKFTFTEFELSADLRIALTRNPYRADRVMCIENAHDLPESFWRKMPKN